MRRRISLFVLAALMVLPAVAPVGREAGPDRGPRASAEPEATPSRRRGARTDARGDADRRAEYRPPQRPEDARARAQRSPAVATPSPDAVRAARNGGDYTAARADRPLHRPPRRGATRARPSSGWAARTGSSPSAPSARRSAASAPDLTRSSARRSRPIRASSRSSRTRSSRSVPDHPRPASGAVFTKSNTIAKINGVDERVDADVAIVDTGIQPTHPDLNVAGGYNCSTSDRSGVARRPGHGTHVAGTVGAKDNTIGVVGVAPGARCGRSRSSTTTATASLRGTSAASTGSSPSATRPTRRGRCSRPSNMSVAKSGDDDRDCGASEKDILHLAICRVVDGRRHGRRRGRQRPDERRALGAGRLQRGHHGLGAGRHRRQAGRPRRHCCFSWGSYDSDDTYANFSNYGGADVDIIAPASASGPPSPARPLRLFVGDVDGRAARDRRGGALQGEPAEGHAGRGQGSAPVPRQPQLEDVTDPDSTTRSCSTCRSSAAPGLPRRAPDRRRRARDRRAASMAITINRSSTFFERVRLSVSGMPDGLDGHARPTQRVGWTAKSARLNVTGRRRRTPIGTYRSRSRARTRAGSPRSASVTSAGTCRRGGAAPRSASRRPWP